MLLLHLCWAGSKVSALCRVPLAAPFATSDDIWLISIHYYWLSGSLSCKHCNIFRDNENDKNETWISRLARSSGWCETEESRPRETREERLPWPAHQLGNWFIKMGHGRYNNKKHKKWHKKTETTRKAGQEKPGGRPANHQNPLNYLHKSQHLNSDRDQSSSTFIPQRSRVTLPAVRPLVGPAQIFYTNFAQIFDHIFYQNFILVQITKYLGTDRLFS